MDTEKSCALETARLLTLLFTEIGSQFHRQALDIFSKCLFIVQKIKLNLYLKYIIRLEKKRKFRIIVLK